MSRVVLNAPRKQGGTVDEYNERLMDTVREALGSATEVEVVYPDGQRDVLTLQDDEIVSVPDEEVPEMEPITEYEEVEEF